MGLVIVLVELRLIFAMISVMSLLITLITIDRDINLEIVSDGV